MSDTIIDSNVISEPWYIAGIYGGYCLAAFTLFELQCSHGYVKILMTVSCSAFFVHINFQRM